MTTHHRWLRVSQAAAILQVAPKTLSRWAKEGKVPYQRTLGGHTRFDEEQIRALVAANTVRVGEVTTDAAGS